MPRRTATAVAAGIRRVKHSPSLHAPRRRRAAVRSHKAASVNGALRSKSRAPSATPSRSASLTHALWPASGAALLFGIAVTLAIGGLVQALGGERDATGLKARSILGASFLALAIGVRVPERFAVWVCMVAWRRFVTRGARSPLSGTLIHPGAGDRPLYWLVLSVLALAAGLSAALLPFQARLGHRFHAWMHARFLWSDLSVEMLDLLTAFLVGWLPLVLLGLTLASAHHLCCRFGQWNPRALAWSLVGASVGLPIAFAWQGVAQIADPILIAAALPALIVSAFAAILGSSHADKLNTPPEPLPPTPQHRDRRPTLLRASVAAVGGGSACAIVVAGMDAGLTVLTPGVMLAALGAGTLLGSREAQHRGTSLASFGLASAAAGTITAGAACTLAGGQTAGSLFAWLIITVAVGTIGFAAARGRGLLLARVASRSAMGAQELGWLFLSTALTVTVTAPLAIHFLGRRGTLFLLALSLVAVGLTLVIREPTRRFRISPDHNDLQPDHQGNDR